MSKPRRISRWLLIAAMFGGGTVFQTTTCNEVAASVTAGWMTTIANNFISSWMNQRFRVPTVGLSL